MYVSLKVNTVFVSPDPFILMIIDYEFDPAFRTREFNPFWMTNVYVQSAFFSV
jgi:hypothetical protein